MSSFGVIVRSGRPYTLPTAPGAAGRLHLTQVSLDDGPGENTVTVCCTVGNKVPIIVARLLPLRAESLQLDLRYNLSEEATFSVLGPRKVHLAGYFDRLDVAADSESFGEDIAQTESEKSVDDDMYEDSFINDSDLGDSSSFANSSFEAKERPIDDDNKRKPNGKKRSHQRLRKVGRTVSSTDSSGQSGGNGTKIKAVVSDSDDDIEFYENSLLKRKLPANGSVGGAHQKSMSAVQDLTRNSEQVNDLAEKLAVPDTEGLLVSSPTKQSAKRKESKEGSKDADPGSLRANGTMEGELRQNIIDNTHEAGKPALSHQMTVEAATESKAKKKKHVKGDPNQNVNGHIHEAGKPVTAIPCSPHTAKETDLELKAKKMKKQVKGELGGTDELTKQQVSGIPVAMDEKKQLVSVKCLEAGKADHSSLQLNELVKDDSVRSKVKRKKHDVKGQNSAVVDNETETTGVIPATAVASPEKVEDESKKEKSDKCKKKRKRSESSNNVAEVVDTEPRAWTSPNGVVVEELVRGNPDGKIALPGKKISVHYVGKLEGSNDFTTSSNSPLKFRLGARDAIAGWNEGLEGVRTGGKRRLTVPTPQSPGNDHIGSRMIYEIEVLRVC